MQGVLSSLSRSPQQRPEIVCAECGHIFRPQSGAAASDALCDECYRAESEPLRLRHWQQPRREHHAR